MGSQSSSPARSDAKQPAYTAIGERAKPLRSFGLLLRGTLCLLGPELPAAKARYASKVCTTRSKLADSSCISVVSKVHNGGMFDGLKFDSSVDCGETLSFFVRSTQNGAATFATNRALAGKVSCSRSRRSRLSLAKNLMQIKSPSGGFLRSEMGHFRKLKQGYQSQEHDMSLCEKGQTVEKKFVPIYYFIKSVFLRPRIRSLFSSEPIQISRYLYNLSLKSLIHKRKKAAKLSPIENVVEDHAEHC